MNISAPNCKRHTVLSVLYSSTYGFLVSSSGTVLHNIKLMLMVQIRFRFGSVKSKSYRYFHHDVRYLRALYIVWSLVRRRVTRVTRRLTRLQTIRNILKYRKTLYSDLVRLRFGYESIFFNVFNLLYKKTSYTEYCICPRTCSR